ncbi:MAG TPA: hypothetical protein VGI03_14640 [Verrucomicrobiae bacterium]
MDIPCAREAKAGSRFSVQTPNGIVEFRVSKFSRGKGDSKFLTTWDGTTAKQVVREAECSVFLKGLEFKGATCMVHPMDNGSWAVRLEFLITDDEFWEGMP